MDHIGIDVHKSESQISILTEPGERLERRIRTLRERFAELLVRRSQLCADGRHLQPPGEDRPAQSPALMDACRLGAYRPAHRTSDAQRQVRAALAVRDALVRTRARFISLIRALLRREGLRVPSGSARAFPQRLATLTVHEPLSAEVAPLLAVMETLNLEIEAADARLAQHAAVALARRLAGILYAMWRDGTDYQPQRVMPPTQEMATMSLPTFEQTYRTGSILPQVESGWVSAKSSLTAVESRSIDGAPTLRISPCAGDRSITPVRRG